MIDDILNSIDFYLDLFKIINAKEKGIIIKHSDGLNYTENIMCNNLTRSYSNGDMVVSKINYDENNNVISFEKILYDNKYEIKINILKK